VSPSSKAANQSSTRRNGPPPVTTPRRSPGLRCRLRTAQHPPPGRSPRTAPSCDLPRSMTGIVARNPLRLQWWHLNLTCLHQRQGGSAASITDTGRTVDTP
jgi:hypothetical protein